MKKNILLGWAVALAALLTGACTQQPLPSTETQPGTGTMIVRPLLQGDLSTRSGEAYTGELASEKAISNIQVLTFDKPPAIWSSTTLTRSPRRCKSLPFAQERTGSGR